MTFPEFFETSTGHSPHPWQERLATDPDCQSRLIDIPTGLGKTAGVVLAWLWSRCSESKISNSESQMRGPAALWPRRLVYCLPMRTLVEQTAGEVERWLTNLWNARDQLDENATTELAWLCGFDPEKPDSFTDLPTSPFDHLTTPPLHDSTPSPVHHLRSPVILMGGEDLSEAKRDWDLYPEKPAILIGTQDMLLSRALNRGYGMSRYRWPMHFALLNNDALWVMDEVQLMGSGLETSAQLQGLRNAAGVSKPSLSWWMSATISAQRLDTPDFRTTLPPTTTLKLSSDDLAQPEVQLRARAPKSVRFSDLRLNETKATEIDGYAASIAERVEKIHEDDSLTLVILNRIDRAQAVYRALKASTSETPMALIHSRFRPGDRAEQMKLLDKPGGGIVVATQAVEAGLDISARHLFTEIAPWSSLVQRFGRCNRDGKQPDGGNIHWIDLENSDEKKMRDLALPYSADALNQARVEIARLTDASPEALRSKNATEPSIIRPILRKKDLLDLFDTTPDLAGLDLDVSRYIRDGNDTDVEVFWRKISKDQEPDAETGQPSKAEICRVSIAAFRAFAKKAKGKGIWRWQGQTNSWEAVAEQNVHPGMTCLIACELGGYSSDLGWTGDPKATVAPLTPEPNAATPEAYAEDRLTRTSPESLQSHTDKVASVVETIASILVCEKSFQDALQTASLWHDLGKAHYHFQTMLLGDKEKPENGKAYLAKSDQKSTCGRRFFRHELASALGWLALSEGTEMPERNLVAYLIAAHHGKVRLSIRAMPNEQGSKTDPGRPFARGVWDGEQIPYEDWPAIELNAKTLPPLTLDLSPQVVGGDNNDPSWLERTLALRDRADLGPFALAFLETLLRAADGRASKEPEEPVKPSEMNPKQQPA